MYCQQLTRRWRLPKDAENVADPGRRSTRSLIQPSMSPLACQPHMLKVAKNETRLKRFHDGDHYSYTKWSLKVCPRPTRSCHGRTMPLITFTIGPLLIEERGAAVGRCGGTGVTVDRRVEFLKSHMNRDRCTRLSAESLARMVNLSTSHLAHLFRRETKVSPQRFAKLVRMRHAKFLLETSFLSVKQVMADSGFHDASHFVRDFRRLYGKSPSQYRKDLKIRCFANK